MSAASKKTPSRVEYADANDVWGRLVGGGSIRVEEWPKGDIQPTAARLGDKAGTLLLEIAQDIVGGAPMDMVSMHPDEDNRVALIGRAIQALEAAREALMACGYVDRDQRQAAS
jgi:hypothetical protein